MASKWKAMVSNVALTNEREKKICEKYGARDKDGRVHCCDCPLKKGDPIRHDFRCKANSHYDRKLREWVPDDIGCKEYVINCSPVIADIVLGEE